MKIINTCLLSLMAVLLLSFWPSAAAQAEEQRTAFGCFTSANDNGCTRTYYCPKYFRPKAAKALCNLEGVSLDPNQLDALPDNRITVTVPSNTIQEGQCRINDVKISQGTVALARSDFPGSKGTLSYSCQERDYYPDHPEWMGGDCQIKGEVVCERYHNEIQVAEVQVPDTTDIRPGLQLQGIVSIGGDYWLVTQRCDETPGFDCGSGTAPGDGYLLFTLTDHGGKLIKRWPKFSASNDPNSNLGHGQSLFAIRQGTSQTYTVLTDSKNGRVLPRLRLTLAANPADSVLSIDSEVKLFTTSGAQIEPVSAITAFAINAGKMRVATVRNDSTGARLAEIFVLASDWQTRLLQEGKLIIQGQSHNFVLDAAQFASHQGIGLMDNSLVSLSGSSLLPPVTPGTSELEKRLYVYPVDLGLGVGKAGSGTVTRHVIRVDYTAALAERYKTTDQTDATQCASLNPQPSLQCKMLNYEPESLFVQGDDIYFSMNFGKAQNRVRRIYRMYKDFTPFYPAP